MRKALATLVMGSMVGSLLFATGCKQKTFETEVERILQEKYKKTPEEAKIGVVKAERDLFLKVKKVDGKEKFEPNYLSITVDERVKQAESMANDVGELLSFKNDELVRLVDEFQMREQLGKDEKAILFNLNKYKFVALHQQFAKLMGLTEQETPLLNESLLLYPAAPVEKTFLFDAKYVREAREKNQLTPSDKFAFTYSFELEIPNPEYPNIDKTKATIRVPRTLVGTLLSYDVDVPNDHNADYLEVFRGNEKSPAIKVFHPTSSSELSVAVLDTDNVGEEGYGVPDKIVPVDGLGSPGTALRFFDNQRSLLAEIYQSKEKKQVERIRPKEKEVKIHVVKVGDIVNDPWEYDKVKGFTVPYDYDFGENYSRHYLYEPLKKEERHKKGKLERKIKYIAKRWHTPDTNLDINGRVVTYHKVLPAYASSVLEVSITGHRMVLTCAGKPDISGPDSLFIENEPCKITYDSGDDSRFTIEDKDGKLPKYEARLEQRRPLQHELDGVKGGDNKDSSCSLSGDGEKNEEGSNSHKFDKIREIREIREIPVLYK